MNQDREIRVLVVDDEIHLLDLLEQVLFSEGYQCDTAPDAKHALVLLQTRPYDLMITDIEMPGIRGPELTKKAKELNSKMLVIIMTGFIDKFTYDRAVEAGASDFIKKPFTANELLIRVKHVLWQDKMRTMPHTDELTGLLNRRGFFSLAEQELKSARRNGSRLVVVLVEVDNMKVINTRLGNSQGDSVLISTAGLLMAAFQDTGIIGRIGGDEFAIIPREFNGNCTEDIEVLLRNKFAEQASAKSHIFNLLLNYGIACYNPMKTAHLKGCSIRRNRF